MKCVAVALLVAALAACSTHDPRIDPDLLYITGELVYRERMALPPNGIARVTLADVAMADPVSPIAAQTEIELDDRQIPIPFELSTDRWALSDRGQYVLRAEIADARGRLLFTTDPALPIDPARANHNLGQVVLTRASANGASANATDTAFLCGPTYVEARYSDQHLVLEINGRRHELSPARSGSGARYVSSNGSPPTEFWEHHGEASLTIDGQRLPDCQRAADADLTPFIVDREWVVEDIGGDGVIDFSRVTVRFGSDGTVAGMTGCNTYSGQYSLTGRTLETSALISTRKACAPALMGQESRFTTLLEAAERLAPGPHGALLIRTATGTSVLARAE